MTCNYNQTQITMKLSIHTHTHTHIHRLCIIIHSTQSNEQTTAFHKTLESVNMININFTFKLFTEILLKPQNIRTLLPTVLRVAWVTKILSCLSIVGGF